MILCPEQCPVSVSSECTLDISHRIAADSIDRQGEENGQGMAVDPVAIVVTLVGYVIGTITMVDFYGAGVVMVIMFYLFRGKEPWN